MTTQELQAIYAEIKRDKTRYKFHLACFEGNVEVMLAMLHAGEVDVNARGPRGATGLYVAASCGRARAVEALLQHPNVDLGATTVSGRTVLWVTISRCNLPEGFPKDVVDLLLARDDIDANAVVGGRTVLQAAICMAYTSRAALYLLSFPKIDPCFPDGKPRSPLVCAIERNWPDVVRAILDSPAMTKDHPQLTGELPALHIAINYDNLEAFIELFNHPKVDKDICDGQDRYPLERALYSQSGHRVFRYLVATLTTEQLNAPQTDLANILSLACESKRPDLVATLLQRPDLDVNMENEIDGTTPLFVAIENDAPAILRLLLDDPRVDVRVTNAETDGAILVAYHHCKGTACLKMLLEDGRCDPNQSNCDGDRALTEALFDDPEGDFVSVLLSDSRVDVMLSFTDPPEGRVVWLDPGISPRLIDRIVRHPTFRPNIRDRRGRTPLGIACENASPLAVARILACSNSVDVSVRYHPGAIEDPPMTAEEVARALSQVNSSPEAYLACANMVREYTLDPHSTRLKIMFELDDFSYGDDLFALAVFVADGVLAIPHVSESGELTEEEIKARRFLGIAAKLCLELQMILCNRGAKNPKDLIGHKRRIESFVRLSQVL